ncbi:MAG: hypothetical protein JNK79_06130 [Chitinophagaceae bacterium]|nr:hypothetical protein [Chitinophagaceae bacterium]
MKTMKNLVILTAVIFSFGSAIAQSDSSFASRRALLFADSLLNSFRTNNLSLYTELSYPGIVEYYGGKKNFEEYLRRAKAVNSDESPDQVRLVQLLNNTNEWQCVIQKTHKGTIDNNKALITTYLVGQSVDKGETWKFFDVAYNSVSNAAYIMPDIFTTLVIPQREVVFYHTTSQAISQQDPTPPAHL